MTAIIGSLWGPIAGLIAIVVGGLVAYVTKKSADAKVAQANQKVAESNVLAEQAKTQAANVQNAEAQANATAAQAGAESLKEKVNVTNDVAALPDGAAASELRDEWTKN